jgi:hypothetical protein
MVEKILAIGGLSAAALVGIPVAISLAARFEGFLTGRLLILAWAIAVILASSRTIRRWRMRTIN